MRVELDTAERLEGTLPRGITVRSFTPADASAVHALLEHGYRHGGGSVAPFETWLATMTSDAEFDPELWFLAEASSALAGVALCWTSAFVKDLVVHETWRRQGLGAALLRHVFAVFVARGAAAVELKVMSDNSAAVRLYERVGMYAVAL